MTIVHIPSVNQPLTHPYTRTPTHPLLACVCACVYCTCWKMACGSATAPPLVVPAERMNSKRGTGSWADCLSRCVRIQSRQTCDTASLLMVILMWSEGSCMQTAPCHQNTRAHVRSVRTSWLPRQGSCNVVGRQCVFPQQPQTPNPHRPHPLEPPCCPPTHQTHISESAPLISVRGIIATEKMGGWCPFGFKSLIGLLEWVATSVRAFVCMCVCHHACTCVSCVIKGQSPDSHQVSLWLVISSATHRQISYLSNNVLVCAYVRARLIVCEHAHEHLQERGCGRSDQNWTNLSTATNTHIRTHWH